MDANAQGIHQWIQSFRQQVERALAEDSPMSASPRLSALPSGARLEAQRVTLNLQLAVPAALSEQASGAQLTIQFAIRPSAQALQFHVPSNDVSTVPSQLSGSDLQQLILKTGTDAFGPGGFDNSARAEIFSEVVNEMETPALLATLAAVEAGPDAPAPEGLGHIVNRFRQILGFAPVGREEAARRLRDLFNRGPLAEIASTLAREWRFGTHWPEKGPGSQE